VWWHGRQWAVTEYGIERLDGTYVIDAKRLTENIETYGWPGHMRGKDWVDPGGIRDGVARDRADSISPASSGLRLRAIARHSQPSSSVDNCPADSAIEPVLVIGQMK
jgi:hypothetical protein